MISCIRKNVEEFLVYLFLRDTFSRPSYRKCIICGCQAQECARTRKHTVEEMQAKIEEMVFKRRF
ncbi:MAG: citrate lyase holo-[acyl-carrier protein] synthase [Mediterraneibacter faecis]